MAWAAKRGRYIERRKRSFGAPRVRDRDLGPGYVTADEARAEFNHLHDLAPPKREAAPRIKPPYWIREGSE